MPSSDRPDRGDASRPSGKATKPDAPIEPPQYFDPSEPWDAQSAEALTRLYESGDGYPQQRPGDKAPRHLSPSYFATPASQDAGPQQDHAGLEARLIDIAARLQASLAEIKPDKAVAHLNQRLDAIETQFNDALGQLVRRSDMDGLKLIEAHVMELAASVEQSRGRLDRIGAIDEQMQELARRLGDGDQGRLDALERLLQGYMEEWRKGDERTAGTLRNLEDVVGRVSESIENIEAYKPAPDLSLPLSGLNLGEATPASDPLSQVYADAARVLEPGAYRPFLDAADYAPKRTPEQDAPAPAPAQPAAPPRASQPAAKATDAALPSPSFLVATLRTRLRQALGVPAALRPDQSPTSREAAGGKPAVPPVRRLNRSNLLLTSAITLFGAIGYLMVDVFMATSAASRRPVEIDHSGPPAEAARTPDLASERAELAPLVTPPGMQIVSANPEAPRIEAIGHVMAAAFRRNDETKGGSVVDSTASIRKDETALLDETATPSNVALPMTIGPASLRQAAMRGEAAAQTEVASRYAAGLGVDRDLQQALQWYSRAATQGLAVAQYRLAALYERGLGAARDPERARAWYARAAEQGNVKAMHNLAVLSVSGGRSDYAAAAKWFAQAADYGLADSQVNLAILYQSGQGVAKDLKLAYQWLAIAGRTDQDAAGRVAQLRTRLSAAQREAADTAVAAWRARTPDPAVNEAAWGPAADLGN